MYQKKDFLQGNEIELSGVSISASDILQQKFTVKFRGYDVQDVDVFLEVVAKEIERLSNENLRFSDELIGLRRDLELYKKKEDSINAALVTVQKMADDVKNNATQEAEQILADGKQQAKKTIAEAKQKIDAAKQEIEQLKENCESEARNKVENARAEGERVIDDKRLERARIQEEINSLSQRKLQFQISLRALVETHLKMMEAENHNNRTEDG